MKLLRLLHQMLETETWRRSQAEAQARLHFADYDFLNATKVLDILVQELGVNLEQLRPETRLAEDLAADEDEPYFIVQWFKDDLGVHAVAEDIVKCHTVGELVEWVTTQR